MKNVKYKIMHIVEAFGGGVGHSIKQIYRGYSPDLNGVVVHGERELNTSLFKDSEGIHFIKWNVGRDVSVNDISSLLELLKIVKSERPDIIHCHSSKGGAHGRVVARLLGIPCIYTPHSFSFLRLDISPKKQFLFRVIEKLLSGFATTIACGMEEYAEAVKLGGMVEVVENGVDLNKFYPAKVAVEPKVISVVSVGRICPQKDFEFFKKIALDPRMSHINFLWITGEDNSSVVGVPTNVKLLGKLSPDEIANILRDSTAYINTALWEGLARSVLEGLASGLPLLLRNSPGNREVVFRPSCAYDFETHEEAILAILDIEKKINLDPAYGKINYEVAKQFYDASKTQSRIRSIYDSKVFSKMLEK